MASSYRCTLTTRHLRERQRHRFPKSSPATLPKCHLSILFWMGIKISTTKTLSILFTRNTRCDTSIVNLKIDNSTFALENVVTFLGVLFDKQLTWTPHINYLVDKCKTRFNLMRCVLERLTEQANKTYILCISFSSLNIRLWSDILRLGLYQY